MNAREGIEQVMQQSIAHRSNAENSYSEAELSLAKLLPRCVLASDLVTGQLSFSVSNNWLEAIPILQESTIQAFFCAFLWAAQIQI